jgi:uncharacterized RDD family membrane protein YckC
MPQPGAQPESGPATVAGGEDLLGLRIAAALIDLAILGVLAVVLGATIGEASVDGGTFSNDLGGAGLAVFLGLAFLYYFVLEATIGRTVGKLLVGLKVVGPDGDRASVWAVGVRTVLRSVDWLPLMYLAGFVTAMATGVRRQRLGDLAAKTEVARALPVPRRGVAAALLGFFLVVVLGISVVSVAASDDASTTFRAQGVSFDYPADWRDATGNVTYDIEGTGSQIAAVGVGEHDLILVSSWRTDRPITAENLDAAAAGLTPYLTGWPGWTLQAGPEQTTMGGMPGLRYESTGTVSGDDVTSSFVFGFDGPTVYALNCQSTPEHTAEIQTGCKQILRTFEVE